VSWRNVLFRKKGFSARKWSHVLHNIRFIVEAGKRQTKYDRWFKKAHQKFSTCKWEFFFKVQYYKYPPIEWSSVLHFDIDLEPILILLHAYRLVFSYAYYIPTCIYNNMHTYSHNYKQINKYKHVHINIVGPTWYFVHIYIQTFIHTKLHTWLHTYMHT